MARLARARILLPAAACALAGHAVVYGTLWPAGAAHGYFGWYEPLLGGASLAALVVLGALLLLAFGGSERATDWLRTVVPSRTPGTAAGAHRLALTSLAILLAQETLESSLSSGRFVPGAFSGTSLLLLVAFLWAASAALVLASRAYAALARTACRPPRAAAASLDAPRRPSFRLVLRAPSPLAACRALRAPPRLLSA
jgi:hypothetical protein